MSTLVLPCAILAPQVTSAEHLRCQDDQAQHIAQFEQIEGRAT